MGLFVVFPEVLHHPEEIRQSHVQATIGILEF